MNTTAFLILTIATTTAFPFVYCSKAIADDPSPSAQQIEQWQNDAAQGNALAISELFDRNIEPSPELIQRVLKGGHPGEIYRYLVYFSRETLIIDTQYKHGEEYYYGENVRQDYSEAVRWYRMAAEKGHDYAQAMLGQCYLFGHGVETNYPVAARWLRKSADQGIAGAQYNLGLCLETGRGVIKDDQEAYQWYLLASAAGVDPSTRALLRLEEKLSASERLAATLWAKQWKPVHERQLRLEQIRYVASQSVMKTVSPKRTARSWAGTHLYDLVILLCIGISTLIITLYISIRRKCKRRDSRNVLSNTTHSDDAFSSTTQGLSRDVSSDDEPLDKQAEAFNASPMVKMGMMKPLPDCDQFPDAIGPFGECVTNPIPVNGHDGTFAYLSRLRSRSGVGFMWHRLGSEETTPYPKPVDIYELVAIDASEWRKLYFGIYHRRRSTMTPAGLTLLPWSQMKDIERVMAKIGFPGHNQKVENFPFGLPAIIEQSERLNQIMPDLGHTMAKTVQKWLSDKEGKWGAASYPL